MSRYLPGLCGSIVAGVTAATRAKSHEESLRLLMVA